MSNPQGAPVCNISVTEPTGKPGSPAGLQTIPPNATLKQAIRIINDNIRRLSPKPLGPQLPPGFPGQAVQTQHNWVEQSRVTETVRVFNPDDHSQFVDIEQINQLTMKDQGSGATWRWNREPS